MTDDTRTPSSDTKQAAEEPQRSAGRELLELLGTLAVALVLALLLRTYVVEPFRIPTGSMIPTIIEGDQVLANKFIYRFESPKWKDIVVLDDPTGETPMLIKRVIAVGGQTVDLKDGAVYIDGKKLDEPYTHGKPSEPGPVPMPVKVPQGSVWVMGDNRPMSKDSRWIGPQPVANVHGKAFCIYWPISRWTWFGN